MEALLLPGWHPEPTTAAVYIPEARQGFRLPFEAVAEMWVVDSMKMLASTTGHREGPRYRVPLGTVEAPGTTEHPRRTAGPEEDGAAPGTFAALGPVQRASALLTLAARDNSMCQGFQHVRMIFHLQPLLAGCLLQLSEGQAMEAGGFSSRGCQSYLPGLAHTEQSQDLPLVAPQRFKQFGRRSTTGFEQQVCPVDAQPHAGSPCCCQCLGGAHSRAHQPGVWVGEFASASSAAAISLFWGRLLRTV